MFYFLFSKQVNLKSTNTLYLLYVCHPPHTHHCRKIKKQWRLDGTAIVPNQKAVLSNQDRKIACLAIWIDFVFVFVFKALIIAGDYPVVWSSDSQCVFQSLFSLTGRSQFYVYSIQGGCLGLLAIFSNQGRTVGYKLQQMNLSEPFSLGSFQKLMDPERKWPPYHPKPAKKYSLFQAASEFLENIGVIIKMKISQFPVFIFGHLLQFHGQQDPSSSCPCDTLLAIAPIP